MRALLLSLALMLAACGQKAPPHQAAPAEAPPPAPVISAPSHAEAVPAARADMPALSELLPNEPRAPRDGGSGAILLADSASALGAAKNLALCHALFDPFDAVSAAPRPAESAADMRPIYWLSREGGAGAAGAERCAHRLETYDFARAQRLKRKLGLTGAGPYLIVERHDSNENERIAAVIDLSRTRTSDVGEMARYFRDVFAGADDVWDVRRYAPRQAEANLAAFFDRAVSFGRLPFLQRASRRTGCPLSDLADSCAEP